MALPPGTRLGAYETLSPLGAGGMGEVHKALDTRLDREAHATAGLNHPHICTLHDVGHQDGIDFLVMEYLDGETLTDRLATGSTVSETPTTVVLNWARWTRP